MVSNDSEDVYGRNFDKLRSQQEFIQDASRKSSIDFHCRELVDALNHSDNYFTTSSCSGRYLAFAQVKFIKLNDTIKNIIT